VAIAFQTQAQEMKLRRNEAPPLLCEAVAGLRAA